MTHEAHPDTTALNLTPIWEQMLITMRHPDVDAAIVRVKATGRVTPEEIAAEMVERNAVHDRWVDRQH